MSSTSPLRRGIVGDLFWVIPEPIMIVKGRTIEAWNPAAERVLGLSESQVMSETFDLARIFGPRLADLLALLDSKGQRVIECDTVTPLMLDVTVQAMNAPHEEHSIVLMRDVTPEHRHLKSLLRLNEIARMVLGSTPLDVVLQRIVNEAKDLSGAAFSALLILKEGSQTETERFVYNAPRELFPDRLPRAVGLLAVPIETRTAVRLDDIRDHPAALGIPGVHPPIGPLLAVPIVIEDQVLGEIAVANQPGEKNFDQVDQSLLVELGLHAAEAIRISAARQARADIDQARQVLVDVVRHDLATPVAVARGCVDQLQRSESDLAPEERGEVFLALDRSISAIERLSSNLRSDARLENPSLYRDFAEISVPALLDEIHSDLVDYAEQKEVELKVRTEGDAPERFSGSVLLVRQAIENLVTNAIKHSPPSCAAVVTCRREGDAVRFDVRDEGEGISPPEQEGLFDRFTTLRGLPPMSGLGIGLSIVRRVAESHGGTVGVSSQRGHGSTFWISFPITPEP